MPLSPRRWERPPPRSRGGVTTIPTRVRSCYKTLDFYENLDRKAHVPGRDGMGAGRRTPTGLSKRCRRDSRCHAHFPGKPARADVHPRGMGEPFTPVNGKSPAKTLRRFWRTLRPNCRTVYKISINQLFLTCIDRSRADFVAVFPTRFITSFPPFDQAFREIFL